jgi:hypothetical protein
MILAMMGVGVCAYLSRGSSQETPAPAGQSGAIQQLLHSSTYPLTLQFKNLNGDWRRLNIGGEANIGAQSGLASTPEGNVYYTRGETITLGSETYLVTYQVENPNKYTSPLSAAYTTFQMPKLTQDTRLTLNLVNLRASSGLYDITPLNVQEEIQRTNGANNPNP